MKYVSIDLETTGLNPKEHQVLEFAAVIEDSMNLVPLEKLPQFSCFVVPRGNVVGDPFALQMNHEILRVLSERNETEKGMFLYPEELAIKFQAWLIMEGYGMVDGRRDAVPLNKPLKVIAAGKNFASFDRPFLENLEGWSNHIKFSHRSLDPVMMYSDPKDTDLPNTEKCCERMGMHDSFFSGRHRALYDAMVVIQMIRHAWNNFRWEGLPDDWSKA